MLCSEGNSKCFKLEHFGFMRRQSVLSYTTIILEKDKGSYSKLEHFGFTRRQSVLSYTTMILEEDKGPVLSLNTLAL